MEVLMLAMVIAFFGWTAHRRQVRDAEAETEVLQPEPETELWKPHEPWSDVGIAGCALLALGVVLGIAILVIGLS